MPGVNEVSQFLLQGEYMVSVFKMKADQAISLAISLDGKTYAEAQFAKKTANFGPIYTVIPFHRGSLLIGTGPSKELKIGSLYKSNLNGTFFSLMYDNVNRDENGQVDFSRIQGMQGVNILNIVLNAENYRKGEKKQVSTLITYDDGQTWKPLPPPEFDATGKKYECASGEKKTCSLHLHAYLDRKDSQNLFDSPSAPGFFLAVGSVGEYLSDYRDGNVYFTRDAGRTWKEILKGPHQFEFGDHGGILLLVRDEAPTNIVRYSLDQGTTFQTLKITPGVDGDEGSNVKFHTITTRSSGSSQKFILVGNRVSDGQEVLHFLDFSTAGFRKCIFDEKSDTLNDFEPWSFSKDNCLFGRKVSAYKDPLLCQENNLICQGNSRKKGNLIIIVRNWFVGNVLQKKIKQ
jgi:hypothetical protein